MSQAATSRREEGRKDVLWLFAAWLVLVLSAVTALALRPDAAELVAAAAMGIAIAFGGLYLVYTWVVTVGIRERERLRAVLDRIDAGIQEAEHLAGIGKQR